MELSGIFSIIGFAFLGVSCGGGPNVQVVDTSGNPIQEATIVPMTRSYNKPASQTDTRGEARIYQDFPKIEWLTVTKRGYHSAHVSFDQPKPMTVTLRPATTE